MRRSGSRFIAEEKSSAVKGRLKRFQFSVLQAYILEMGDRVMRFYRNQAQIAVADTDAVITNGDFSSDIDSSFSHVWQVDDTPADTAFVDETADANSATDADWQLFPTTEASGDYAAFGFTTPFAQIRFDYANGTAGVGGTVAWQYWNGAAWTVFPTFIDQTTSFTATAADDLKVTWSIPLDWAARTISTSASLFFARALIGTVYGTNPIMDQGFIRSTWYDKSTGGTGNDITHDATNNRLNLRVNGNASDDIGWAEQQVTTTNTSQEHVIKFRVIGLQGDSIEFQVGTTTTGAETFGPVVRQVGWHAVAFTPTTSPFYVQFRNKGNTRNKDLQIEDVSFIDDSAVEIDTPWDEVVLQFVEGPQSADVLYLYSQFNATHKLQRLGNTTWSLVQVEWVDGPYLDENTTATTLTPGATTGLNVTLTFSGILGINGGAGFTTADIGRLIRFKDVGVWGYAIIVGITSTSIVTVDIRKNFDGTNAQVTWRLGAWSVTTGFPQVASFFEQRQYVAATTDQPQTFWATQTGEFENFKPDNDADVVEADDAFDRTLSADDVNAIRWLSAGEDTLVIGTSGGEWVPESTGPALTALDITVRRQTTHGSAQIQPVRVGNVVLFVQRAKRRIREFGFADEIQGFRAPDMTRLARHITKGGIVEMDYAEESESIVWTVRNDGQLLSMTFRRDEDVVGWGRHILGGSDVVTFSRVWQVDDSASTFVDETTDANDTGDADWTLFPATEAVGDYAAFGHTKPFSKITFDYVNGTAGVGGAVAWEFWDGSAWVAHTGVVDNTTGFTATAADTLTVSWTLPANWAKTLLSVRPALFYTRARITTVYSANPVLDQGFIHGDAIVESIAVIPGTDGAGQTKDSTGRDEVWITVKRTINGVPKRYIEFFELDFETGDDQEDAYYADSLITYDSTPATVLTGYGHLIGETNKVWADGAIQADKTVSATGGITIDTAASVVQSGLGFKHKLKTLRISAGNPAGTPLGKNQRFYALTFALLNSHKIKFGPNENNLTEKDFRVVSDPMDAGAPLFTGLSFVEFQGDWTNDARIIIEDDAPAPFTLLAIAPEIQINPLK